MKRIVMFLMWLFDDLGQLGSEFKETLLTTDEVWDYGIRV